MGGVSLTSHELSFLRIPPMIVQYNTEERKRDTSGIVILQGRFAARPA